MKQLGESSCSPDIRFLKVSAPVPFKDAGYVPRAQQTVALPYPVTDRPHYGILCHLFPVSEAEIYAFCPDVVFLDVVVKAREPYRRRGGCYPCEGICLTRCPEGKETCQ